MSKSRLAVGSFAIVTLLMMLPAAPWAWPAEPANLSGTIYDVTGGVIPGAQVAVIDSTGNRLTSTTNASGRFAFANVAAGKYTLETTLRGFRALRQDVELRAPGDWERVVTLQLGELSETISISASRLEPSRAAAPQAAPRAPVRVGGSVRAPRKVRDVKPVYPDSMRQAGLDGLVPLEAIIGADGSVTAVRVLSAHAHPDLAIAAANAVRQWRYSPTLLNGVPVEVAMNVTVRFNIGE